MSTVVAIDRRRKERGISLSALLREAMVHKDSWYAAMRKGAAMREPTLQRLRAALDTLDPTSPKARPPAAIAALIRSIEIALLAEIGKDPRNARRLMAALDPRRRRNRLPKALPAGRLRLLAVYIAAVDLEIGNAEIARALGIQRQAVKQARDQVHELRDDPRADALLDRCALTLRGET